MSRRPSRDPSHPAQPVARKSWGCIRDGKMRGIMGGAKPWGQENRAVGVTHSLCKGLAADHPSKSRIFQSRERTIPSVALFVCFLAQESGASSRQVHNFGSLRVCIESRTDSSLSCLCSCVCVCVCVCMCVCALGSLEGTLGLWDRFADGSKTCWWPVGVLPD